VRAALLVCLLLPLGARGDRVTTSANHEVVHVPPSPFPVRGPRFALVTLDLYFAFGHGPSAAGAELVRRAIERARPGEVRQVLHLALAGPISATPGSELAAEAMLEAAEQDRLWPFVDRLVRDRSSGLSTPELSRAAREAGLDGARLDEALGDGRHRAAVEQQWKDAQAHMHGAGELFVNGRRSSVWTSDEGLQAMIDEARRRAELLVEGGVPLSRLYDQLTAPVEEGQPVETALRGRRRAPGDLSAAPSRGPQVAAVTLVVYSNLACVTCGEISATVRRVREAHPGQVREVWRNFVPSYASTGIDETAAELAVAAAAQGRFWQLHDLTVAAYASGMRRSRPELEIFARTVGVDLTQVLAGERAGRWRPTVERESQEARALGVPLAPSVLVNGLLLVPPISVEKLERVVRAELERGVVDRLQSGP
jgi:protein-disulfide isomerase